MIYVDNAATTKISNGAYESMINCMFSTYGNPSSLHSVGRNASIILNDARKQIAECLNCTPQEIIFTSGGSEADNQALRSMATEGKRNGKMHIISTTFEHHAILNTLNELQNEGFEVELLDVNNKGFVTSEQVEQHIRSDTCFVSVMYANNEIGTIQPITQIGDVCRKHDVVFHTDAVQAVGHIPIDVQKQNIDMLSLSAHKFHGPKGVGVLYVNQGITIHPLIFGGHQEYGKRAGTENVSAIIGMATALYEAYKNMDKNIINISNMRNKLINNLLSIPHSTLNGDIQNRLPGNANFCFDGVSGEELILALDMHNICASSGSACTSGLIQPSHVLLSIGKSYEAAYNSVRFSLCEYNTEEEINIIIDTIKKIVRRLRRENYYEK